MSDECVCVIFCDRNNLQMTKNTNRLFTAIIQNTQHPDRRGETQTHFFSPDILIFFDETADRF
jgi:hypothetical protein